MNAQILESQGRTPTNSINGDAQYAQRSVQAPQASQNRGVTPTAIPTATPTEANKYATADYKAASSELAMQNPELQNTLNSNSKTTVGTVFAEKEVEVEYDLSDSKKSPTKKSSGRKSFGKSKSLGTHKIASISNLKGTFVQTGAFSTLRNAKKSSEIMKKFAKVQIEESKGSNKNIYRVLLGPFFQQNISW